MIIRIGHYSDWVIRMAVMQSVMHGISFLWLRTETHAKHHGAAADTDSHNWFAAAATPPTPPYSKMTASPVVRKSR